ncbi:MAG: metallopeptidase TldD-related protein [Clostridiaceae bacterium]|nr:TldD/PmbA family protein [Eubacteriales bacterium]
MEFLVFRDKAFEHALKNGCGAAEVYFNEMEELEVQALEGALDKYAVSRKAGLNLRVQVGGKNGYAYTESLDDPEALVLRAMDNARSVESDDEHPMQGKSEYRAIEQREIPLLKKSEREKIELAFELEKKVKALDGRVKRLMHCNIVTAKGNTRIHNTLGLQADKESEIAVTYAIAVLEQNGEAKDGFAFRANGEAMELDAIASEAVREGAASFGASSVPVGKYRILLRNDAAAGLLDAFSGMFSADQAQKGLSLLKDKEGETVASDIVTILDDPFHAFAPRAFDGEGVPCVKKAVVENGVFKTLLHNLKTAKKAGVASTGNAGRAGAAAPVDISPTNFYIVPGKRGYDELLKELGNGLVLTELSGMHAGLNTVSGEFSLLAKGFLVENGKVVRAVDQITAAGSFLSLMRAVLEVGSDLRFGFPGSANVGSPSLLIEELMVSGK